jgi:TatD DNase family protein
MQLVDTHVHINFPDFQDDLEEVRLRWQAAGVSHLVHSCVEPTEFLTIQGIAHCFPELSFAVGLHPLSATQWTEQMGETITQLAQSDHRVVAIGETGLDYYKSDHHEGQRKAFWAQLEIAHSLNLPVIIHCREASEDMITILHQFLENMGSVTGVMHCWGEPPNKWHHFLH